MGMQKSLRVLQPRARLIIPAGSRTLTMSDNQPKSVVRHVVYGLDKDKYGSALTWCKTNLPEIRSRPGVKKVEAAVCVTGRLGLYYEFNSVDSWKAYVESGYFRKLQKDLMAQP